MGKYTRLPMDPAKRKKPEEIAAIPKDATYQKLTLQDPAKNNWFDVLDEEGRVLLRIGVFPQDKYHTEHGRIGLAYNSEDHQSTMHW